MRFSAAASFALFCLPASVLTVGLAPGCKKDKKPGAKKSKAQDATPFSCETFMAKNKRCVDQIAAAIGEAKPTLPKNLWRRNAESLSSPGFGRACAKWTKSSKEKDVKVIAGWKRCFPKVDCAAYGKCIVATGKKD